MNAKQLNILHDLKKLIERDEERLADLESRLRPGGVNMDGMPHAPGVKNPTEEISLLIMEMKGRIEREKEAYAREVIEIEAYINAVDDHHVRLIMLYRFVNLLTWQQIANRIGGGNTADSCRKSCFRYIDTHK